MYAYDRFDKDFLQERVAQFRGQVARHFTSDLSDEEFKPLRLMNGLYLELNAYMLRVAIPYGVLSAKQLHRLSHIASKWDRGYGHFTTRQNIQFNWVKLSEAGDILEALAEVDMHAIQTSGNCVRNVTTDPLAGATNDEIEDPRPWCEAIRQWSTLHPEFAYLPRKFKIAVSAGAQDRAAVLFHDIGIRIVRGPNGKTGFRIFVGGGQGRNPFIAQEIRRFLDQRHLLSYLEAILRVYNLHGRRDNLYKSRLKILVRHLGIERFREQVEREWQRISKKDIDLPEAQFHRIARHFAGPDLQPRKHVEADLAGKLATDTEFARWLKQNVRPHRVPGYAIVAIPLKGASRPPGDMSAQEMAQIADIAAAYGHDEIRVTYAQNLILPHVARRDLFAIYEKLTAAGLDACNTGLVADIICCPGMDYCSLANARSLPIAKALGECFEDIETQQDIGPIRLNISGCINACGHHHAGNIGILGVDKKGEELYQITLGGEAGEKAAIGKVVGPGFPAARIPKVIDIIIATYRNHRQDGEHFIDTLRRVGHNIFKEALYVD